MECISFVTAKHGAHYLLVATDKVALFNTVGHFQGSLVGFVRYVDGVPTRLQELVAVMRLAKTPTQRKFGVEFYSLERADTIDAEVIRECLSYQNQQNLQNP
jgi:hypothetical protein